MPETTDRLDRLYRLLPAFHRARDAEQGEPLRALLQVISSELNVVEDDISRLYDNWFIETCEEWVVPYIADLLGFQNLELGDAGPALGNQLILPRRDVANAIRNRRRKGTLALLEEMARDVANWPARALEFVQLLAVTPALNHSESLDRGCVDVRRGADLDRLGGAFETSARTLDVRRSGAAVPGRYNVGNVGLFVWRLAPFSVTHVPACCLEEVGPEWYCFSALGNDTQLVVRPEPEPSATSIATTLNVPADIRRRQLHDDLGSSEPQLYGRSFAIWAEDWPHKGDGRSGPIPASAIMSADLSDFQYTAPRGRVLVDPVLGRIAFPPKQLPKRGVWVSYLSAFSAAIGGGEYTRPLLARKDVSVIRVQGQEQLREALHLFHARRRDDGTEHVPADQPEHALIEIADGGVYVLPFNLLIGAHHSLQIRAAQRMRPVIRLLDWQTDRPDSLAICGGPGSRFTLDGVIVTGRGMRIEGELASVSIRHATLVPGWSLSPSCDSKRPAEPSIEIVNSQACLVVEHSIVGSIQVNVDEVMAEPINIRISDSIVDASGHDQENAEAIGASGSERAHAVLQVARTTILGQVLVHAIELAEDSIFHGCVSVARRQIGCLRYCSLSHCSRTPRRFHCQPDEAEAAAVLELGEDPSEAQRTAARMIARRRVRPRFTSLRFGQAAYCQLAQDCAEEITRGASDESELGAFHDLFQPQRAANLQARLLESTPSSTDVGIVFVT